MKFRNRFFKYGVGQNLGFLNAGAYQPQLFCSVDGDDDNSGGGDDSGNAGDSITLSKEELNAMIAESVSAAMKSNNTDDKAKGNFEKIQEDLKNQESEKNKLAETRKTVAFDMGFDGFIKSNSRSFSISVEKFRESAKGLEGEELERTLSVTAAKDFFKDEENINLLPERDRDYVKTQVVGLADNAIDYRKAWQLIEDALHVKRRITENGQYKNNTSQNAIDNSDTPNVTAYLKKCVDSGRRTAST